MLKAIQIALTGNGFQVRLLRATPDGDFVELQVSRHGQTTQLDLRPDWLAHEAVTLDVGPVLHLDDAAARKPPLPYLPHLNEVADLRGRFADWPRDPGQDATAPGCARCSPPPGRSAVQPAAAA